MEQPNTMSQPPAEPQATTTASSTNPKVSVHIRGIRANRDPINITIRLAVSLPDNTLTTLAVFKEVIRFCVIDPNDRFGIVAALKPLQHSEKPLRMFAAKHLYVELNVKGQDGVLVDSNPKFIHSVLKMIEKPDLGYFYTEVVFKESNESSNLMREE